MRHFFYSLKSLKAQKYLQSDEALVVLQWLVSEVCKLGGFAGELVTPASRQKHFVLGASPKEDLLAVLRRNHTGKTGRALMKVLRSWTARRRFTVRADSKPDFGGFLSRADFGTNLRKLSEFRQRDFNGSPNESHPLAKRIFSTSAVLNEEGRLEVSIQYGYPRDSSSWTIYPDDEDEGTYSDSISQMLFQRIGEGGPTALSRMVSDIESKLVPLTKPDLGHRISEEHEETLRREELYVDLKQKVHVPHDYRSIHTEQPADEGTRARFGNAEDQPYFLKDELVSMLADFITGHPSEAECRIFTDGLRTVRRFKKANQLAKAFGESIVSREFGHPTHPDRLPQPAYEVLKACLEEVAKQGGLAEAWVPKGNGEGLIRVPLSGITFNKRNHKITFDDRTLDVGVIRQIDCVPSA